MNNLLLQVKRIERLQLSSQELLGVVVNCRRIEQPLHRCLWRIILFDDLRSHAFLRHEFDRGQEVIEQVPPFRGVESVDHLDELGFVKTFVAEKLSDVCPVFVFDVSIIVFVVSA